MLLQEKYYYIYAIITTLLFHCDPCLTGGDKISDPVPNDMHLPQQADPEYIKRELKEIILTKIDSDKDGSVSYDELKTYLAELHEKNIDFNVDKQWAVYSPQIHEVYSWEGYEPEKKQVLTWDHYFNQTYPDLIGIDVGIPFNREQDTSSIKPKEDENGNQEQPLEQDTDNEDPNLKLLKTMVRRADARWRLADENDDTLLTKQEFKNLLHPDEGHEELKNLFIKEAVEDMDLDKDGKICLDEFMKHIQILASDQERKDQNWLASQQENFGRFLDKNKDGVLDGDEIREWLVPVKSKRIAAEAKRLLDIGDTNSNFKLSNAEIIQDYEQYLSLLPSEYWSTPDEIQDPTVEIQHDEL